ncbi:MAG: hypothetical protein Q7J57_11265 [Gemmobacter sp.]|nr:hypothetical protein [Gemmobacter sp.]
MTRTDPLIVYIHIPKTAGSTLNHILQRWDRAGMSHCEAIIDDPVRLRKAVANLTWISGHVSRDRMRSALSAVTERPLRLFTVLREPTRQLMSHYNWLIEIHHRGGAFYDGHPPQIKAISEQIRGTDNSDPAAVIENLKRYRGLLLNNQSKVALANPPDWFGPKMVERLQDFEAISSEHHLQDLIWHITDTDVSLDARENESGYHFDRAVFSDPLMQAFLRDHHAFDYRLYKLVREQELGAEPTPDIAEVPSESPAQTAAADTLAVTESPGLPEDRILRQLAYEIWRTTRFDLRPATDQTAEGRATGWTRDRGEMVLLARRVRRRLATRGVELTLADDEAIS